LPTLEPIRYAALVSGAFVSGAFVSGAFVTGALVSGAFVSGFVFAITQRSLPLLFAHFRETLPAFTVLPAFVQVAPALAVAPCAASGAPKETTTAMVTAVFRSRALRLVGADTADETGALLMS
jgi:hypothetical protein